MQDIDLIALDFDGTVVCYDDDPPFFHPEVVDVLNRLGERGVQWCANSGRTLDSQLEILDASRSRGLRHGPSGVLSDERLVHRVDASGRPSPVEAWNEWADRVTLELHDQVQDTIGRALDRWEEDFAFDQVFLQPLATAFCLADPGEMSDRFHRRLESELSACASARVIRNGAWVAVIASSLGKGNQLRRFCREEGVASSRVLAVGDHLNDLSMLDGEAAAHAGCPGDAHPLVRETVARVGGVIASRPGPAGTAEILRRVEDAAASLSSSRSMSEPESHP